MSNNHWCSEHKAVFFKKGKMKGYAHPIGDTGNWCNEPEEGGDPMPEDAPTEATYKADPDKIKSIERQCALKSATKIGVAQIGAGKSTSAMAIIDIAILFESYLDNGATVSKKPKTKEDAPLKEEDIPY